MILDTEVEVVINNQTIQHYVNKGYNAVYRTPIKVNPYDLTPGSRVVVNIQCDVCYTTYIYAFREVKIGNGGEYICKKCKIRKTRKYLPGVKEGMIEKCKNIIPNKLKNNPNYINEVVEKSKKTKSKRYGDPTYNNQNKKKQTCFEKYGVEHYFDINKKKQTSLKRYGDPTYNNQNKKKQTCFEKYGVEHSSQVDEIFIKYQKSAHVLKRFENTELNYRGSYEYDFLLYCKNCILFPPVGVYSTSEKKYLPLVTSNSNGVIPFSVTTEPFEYIEPNAFLLNLDNLFEVCSANKGEVSINSTSVVLVTTLPN